MVSNTGFRTQFPVIAPGKSAAVNPRVGEGEDDLVLLDSAEHRYVILGYIEGDPGGEVVITIDGVTPDGLTGRVLDRTHYHPEGEFSLQAE